MRCLTILLLLLLSPLGLRAQKIEEVHSFEVKHWPSECDSLFIQDLTKELNSYQRQERLRAEGIRDSLREQHPCYKVSLFIICNQRLNEELFTRYNREEAWKYMTFGTCLKFTIRWEFQQKSGIPQNYSGQILCN